MILLVDGYNVVYGAPESRGAALGDARAELERRLAAYRARHRTVGVEVYWDGDRDVRPSGITRVQGIRVVYTSGSADRAIVERVRELDRPGRVTVVTDDGALARRVRAEGAAVLPVAALAERLKGPLPPGDEQKLRPDTGPGKDITDDLKDVWGA